MPEENKQIVVATTNAHKIAEISAIAGAFGYETISRDAAGVPPDFDVEEDGETFEDNSLLKARAVFDLLGGRVAVAADDSGLCVDALRGAPGVYSARFADATGQDSQDFANNKKLLRLLSHGEHGSLPPEKRTARFVSVVTLVIPDHPPVIPDQPPVIPGQPPVIPDQPPVIPGLTRDPKVIICRGEVEGRIAFHETGSGGFGYDPLFIPALEELQTAGLEKYEGRSFGDFPPEDKNKISHRFRALEKLRVMLNEMVK
ncbi:MAG: non-canonical purine NTP pyrophosphatase [Clostridiales Family XIII bacterium]|jgi:XTP/dITP diphosphohydrolase|nr:non-canonical purine NTP pyrophosphatase [Clostridiales Family XIII bacterium]